MSEPRRRRRPQVVQTDETISQNNVSTAPQDDYDAQRIARIEARNQAYALDNYKSQYSASQRNARFGGAQDGAYAQRFEYVETPENLNISTDPYGWHRASQEDVEYFPARDDYGAQRNAGIDTRIQQRTSQPYQQQNYGYQQPYNQQQGYQQQQPYYSQQNHSQQLPYYGQQQGYENQQPGYIQPKASISSQDGQSRNVSTHNSTIKQQLIAHANAAKNFSSDMMSKIQTQTSALGQRLQSKNDASYNRTDTTRPVRYIQERNGDFSAPLDRAQVKRVAKQQIKGKIGILFVIALIQFVISLVAGAILAIIPFIGPLASTIIISSAFTLSVARVYLNLVAGDGKVAAGDAFSGFDDFWSAFKVGFLTGLFTFLWSLLFIIPGIVKMISYSMSMYILAENKGMPALECIRLSKQITKGHKMELFILWVFWILWDILIIVTLGLAAIYAVPYMTATFVNYYEGLKQSAPELSGIGSEDSYM